MITRGIDVRSRAYIAGICLMIFICTMASGCAKLQELFGRETEETESADFQEDTVFIVGDSYVSRAEWFLYMQPEKEKTEALYGADIWDYPVDSNGKKFLEAFKENIRDRITYVKIVCSRASEFGISLDEDELTDIDIQTQDYLAQLSGDEHEKYEISPELIKQIYSDNRLAMKVYEHLTLNVDTYIPEEEVRHMVLQYIMILKTYTDDEGVNQYYTAEELALMKDEAQGLLASIRENEEIKTLGDITDDSYIVNELVTDKSTLTEKLSEKLAEDAFELREGDISGLIETKEAFFILDCVKYTDTDATNVKKVKIIEERQNELFNSNYELWEETIDIRVNKEVWESIDLEFNND